MPAWKLDLDFLAEKQGWRESYYADFNVASFAAVNGVANKLAMLRIALCSDPVKITSYSVSDPITDGQQGETVDFVPAYAAPAAPLYGASDPATSINVGFQNFAQKRKRRIFMRGIPDIVVTHFGQLDSVQYGLWLIKFNQLRDYLLGLVNGQAGGTVYGWYARKRVAVDPGIATYAYVTGDIFPTFTLPADFFPNDDIGKKRYVRFSGFNNSSSPLNREMVVLVTSRTTARPVKAIAAFPMTTPGICRRYATVPEFVPADGIGVERAGTRRPGAPPLQRRGRSRARARG